MRYLGEFLKNNRHGFGICRWADGSVYRGEWEKGTMQGYGAYDHNSNKYLKRYKYIGQFHKNIKQNWSQRDTK